MAINGRRWRTEAGTGLSTGERVAAGALFGFIGSIPMGLIAMFVMWIAHGDFWAPMKAIAATFLGQSAMDPTNVVTAVIIGALFHMFNGAWLGALFGLMTPGMTTGITALLGIVYGLIIGAGALWVVLPIVDPILAQSATGKLGIGWWFLIHGVFGFVTGLYSLARSWFGARTAHSSEGLAH